MKTQCPNCGKRFSYSPEQKGKSYVCPRCHTPFEVGIGEWDVMSEMRLSVLSVPVKSMSEFYSYLAGLCAVMAVLVGPSLVKGMFEDGTGLVLVIMGVFVLSLILLSHVQKEIVRQMGLLSSQAKQLYLYSQVSVFLQDACDSLFRSHVGNLACMAGSGKAVVQNNLIEIIGAKYDSKLRIVNLLSGIIITLGLIGTILGMLNAVGGLDGLMGAMGNQDGVKNTIGGVLGGVSTAFYTTLVGSVLGSVILRLLGAYVVETKNSLIRKISEICEVIIIPKLVA